jgi:hypothetical protein
MKLFKTILIALLLVLTGVQCSKEKLFEAYGTIRDYTGLDGCGLMIDLDSGGRLEVVSLPPNTTLVAGKRVRVEYKPVPAFSICMAGTTAKIIRLQYL